MSVSVGLLLAFVAMPLMIAFVAFIGAVIVGNITGIDIKLDEDDYE